MKDQLELYVYSTESHLKKGLLKVGQSKIGHHEERIKQQFGTSNPEPPIKLWNHPLPKGITDKKIHAQLIKNGIEQPKNSPGKEWFKANIEDVKKAFNQIAYGSSRTESYKLRNEQKEAVEKAKKWFLKGFSKETYRSVSHQNRFLLNAKMRFGKCFTSLHIAKSIQANNVLICTYKPEVIDEWMDTLNNHVDFESWQAIRARKKNLAPLDISLAQDGKIPHHNGTKVMAVSFQDLDIDKNQKTKVRLEEVLKTKWDLIIFDEVHFGSATDRAKHILKSLNFKYRLDLSGTPFKLLETDDFCYHQVFTYSYLDEQKNKQIEIDKDPKNKKPHVYRQMPDLSIFTVDITDEDIKEQREKFISDDFDFSLNELFKADSKGFIYDAQVNAFLAGLIKTGPDASACSAFGEIALKHKLPKVRHSVWWLSRVESVQALAKKLSNHHDFSKFEIINASGCDNSENPDEVIARDKSILEKKIQSSKQGTITLTCRRFLTGTTIKEWDSILILNDVKSSESYFQAIFRVQSAWINRDSNIAIKKKAYVFDFAISRLLRNTYSYATALADQLAQKNNDSKNLELEENITQGLCDKLDIKRFYEGKLISTKTNAKDIFDALNTRGSRISLARRITSDAVVNFSSLNNYKDDKKILAILEKVKGYRTQEVGSIQNSIQIGLDADEVDDLKKDARDNNKNKSDINKKKDAKLKKSAVQIKRLAICMADFIYMTYEREGNIYDIINTKTPEFFKVMTGITKDEFSLLREKGLINENALTKIVREFREQEESSLRPEEFILSRIKAA